MADQQLEPMAEFFGKRIGEYDDHMRNDVVGCRRGYLDMAANLPANVDTLLDLGVGTGLELEQIFRRFPDARVTGVDLCADMLNACVKKYSGRKLTLIQADYTQVRLSAQAYDAAVSFQTLHHLNPTEKLALFRKLINALRVGGVYAQCDYFAADEAQEAALREQYNELCQAKGYQNGERVHFDTPLTVEHELALLRLAGFGDVRMLWRESDTALLLAYREH
jgi:tRNA (cmo5U34)-methyltransferase